MMSSIAPFWDGNETWLVLGGAGLFAAFPLAYATLLPALYVPVMLMLFALVLRGVAFEYRFKSMRTRRYWDASFSLGAFVAAMAQGVMVGALLRGVPVVERSFAGGSFDWLTVFNLVCGLGVVVGYGMFGATWLVLKTEGRLRDWAYRKALQFLPAAAAFVLLICVWTPLAQPAVAERWLANSRLLMLAPIPLLTAFAGFQLRSTLRQRSVLTPFIWTVLIIISLGMGLAVSLYPFVVPFSVTLWDAAPQRESQMFLLTGVVILLPVVLAYTAYNYWVFRGKVQMHQDYH